MKHVCTYLCLSLFHTRVMHTQWLLNFAWKQCYTTVLNCYYVHCTPPKFSNRVLAYKTWVPDCVRKIDRIIACKHAYYHCLFHLKKLWREKNGASQIQNWTAWQSNSCVNYTTSKENGKVVRMKFWFIVHYRPISLLSILSTLLQSYGDLDQNTSAHYPSLLLYPIVPHSTVLQRRA